MSWRWSAPPQRLAVMRVLAFAYGGIYVAARAPTIVDIGDLPTSRFDPVGAAAWLNGPVSPGWLTVAVVVTVLTSIAAATGWRYRATAPIAALGILFVLSHRLSWGQVLHTENLLVMHTLILAVTPAGDAWSLDARRRRTSDHIGDEAPTVYGWALQLMAAVTALSYVVAAWAKLRNGGLDWISGDVLRNHIARDNLRKHLLGDASSPISPYLVGHAWLFAPMAIVAMVVELAAPIAIVASTSLRHLWVGAAWAFHLGVLALMAIGFPYQLAFVAFVPLVDGERIAQRISRIFRPTL